MSFTHIGLIFDIIGASFIGFESFIKLRGMTSDSLVIGHGASDVLLQIIGMFGYGLLLIGFILQYIGS